MCPNRSHRGDDGTDVAAIADNKITITPLRIDMTDEPFMTKLAELFAEKGDSAQTAFAPRARSRACA